MEMDTTLLNNNLQMLQAVLPNVKIEHKENEFIIEGFIFITHKKMEARTLSSHKVLLDKYDVTIDTGDDVYDIVRNRYFRQAVLEVVKFHAGYKAKKILDQINTEKVAQEQQKV
jgi:ABC-type Fe3+/spermidine/putrescine transport system ATPase subunit